MCNYCDQESCYCGNESASGSQKPCECEVIGVESCSQCGCEAQPWWIDVEIPGGEAVRDALVDVRHDKFFFPATKEKVVKMISDSGGDATFLNQKLPVKTYGNSGDVVIALLGSNLPHLASQQGPADLIWKHPTVVFLGGQELVVADNQQAVLMSLSNKACDVFSRGTYKISRETCPKLAAESRKAVPGFNQVVLSGSAVFLNPSKEFEVDLSASGQTKALRRVVAQGIARAKISSSKDFFEQIAAKNQFRSDATLTALQKYCEEAIRKEMLSHEMEELSNNPSILETAAKNALAGIGLEAVSIWFRYVGEMGPGMFIPSVPKMSGAGAGSLGAASLGRQDAEQMKLLMESMRAAQMERMQMIQQQMAQQNRKMAQANQQGVNVSCQSCGASNPQTSKFCGSCGKPLQVAKKTCPNCGQQSDASIKFCGSCGTKLS
jgi:membrane protease subunit (stomatin/prohibitin family)